MDKKPTHVEIFLFTAMIANILLFALIWAKDAIDIPPSADVSVTSDSPSTTYTTYDYQHEKTYERNGWRIEQYRLYEVTYDASGKQISRKRDKETQYIKYWEEK